MAYANNASGADAASDFTVYPLVLTGSGKVGVGINTPSRQFHIHSPANTVFQITDGTTGTTSTDGFQFVQGGVNTILENQENGYMAFRTNAIEKLRITNAGDVGIGTTTPGYKLDVAGEINATGIRINGTPISGGGSQWSGTSPITYTAGNVGIGTTNPGVAIDVVNSVAAGTGTARFKNTNANTQVIIDTVASQNANLRFDKNASPSWYLGNEFSNDRFRFLNSNSNGNVEVFTILQGGNVGIGTTSPTYPLTIVKDHNGPTTTATFNTADGASAQVGAGVSRTMNWSSKYISWGVTAPSFSSPGYGETAYFHSAGVPLKFGSNTNNDILFFTNGISNTRMTITGGGNVGIGTTNPSAKLELAPNSAIKLGNAYFSSGGDYVHLANNEWYNGTAWTATAPGALIQISGQDVNFYRHDAAGSHTQSMNINSSGNVGIGTTPGALYRLDVRERLIQVNSASPQIVKVPGRKWVEAAQPLLAASRLA